METEVVITENNVCVSFSIPACVEINGLSLLSNSEILQKQYFHMLFMKTLSFIEP